MSPLESFLSDNQTKLCLDRSSLAIQTGPLAFNAA